MADIAGKKVPIGKIITGSIVGVVGLAVVVSAGNLWESLEADQIMVIQSPVKGTLTWHQTPGLKWQGWGRVTKYQKRSQYWFDPEKKSNAKPATIRFNDGGKAEIFGSIAWEMPSSENILNDIHAKYGTQRAIENELVEPVVGKAIYATGPVLSSKESYAERRNDLFTYIEDQIKLGVYKTHTESIKEKDPITGQIKTRNVAKIVQDSSGGLARSEKSPLIDFGIRVYNPTIRRIKYEEKIEKQIDVQQKAIMQVQTARANAQKAEQARITAEREGEAQVAKERAIGQVAKIKAVTLAEQQRDVAKLEKEAATFRKDAAILEGQGEAEKRKLIMSADGALSQKLDAWVEVNKIYASEFAKQKWVADISMGGKGTGGGNAKGFIDMLMMKTAKELSLDMGMKKKQ